MSFDPDNPPVFPTTPAGHDARFKKDMGRLYPDQQPPGRSAGSADGCAWIFALAVLPFAALGSSVLTFAGFFENRSEFFRSLLELFFPSDWIAQTFNGDGEPIRVSVLVVAATVIIAAANLALRRPIQRSLGISGPADLGRSHILSFVMNFVLIFLFVGGITFGGISERIASGADLEPDPVPVPIDGVGPWIFTVVTIGCWSAALTYVGRQRRARRLARP